ncbi:MAG: hypothetical protein JXB62_03870 [Pirellulales bacterium]|nr:hypothetical protein [Pirellulales bacterium]
MKKWRLLALLAVGALLIGGGLLYERLWLTRPPLGRGPAGPPVAREAFAQPWTDRRVFLLGLGDSVTAGFGVAQRHSYFGRLVTRPNGS